MSSAPNRLALFDELRGLLIVVVVLYHLGFDLTALFGVPLPWFWSTPMTVVRYATVALLMLLSGISCSLSRSNLRRGLRTLLLALGLTLATGLFMPSELVVFGILHCFAACMLLWALLVPLLERLPRLPAAALFAALFAVLLPLPEGWLLLPGAGRVALPAALYQSRWLFWLGLPGPGFFSADYYPVLPWFLLFAAGGLLGLHWRRSGFPAVFSPARARALGFLGRHTLLIYLLHQPLLLALLAAVFWLIR